MANVRTVITSQRLITQTKILLWVTVSNTTQSLPLYKNSVMIISVDLYVKNSQHTQYLKFGIVLCVVNTVTNIRVP